MMNTNPFKDPKLHKIANILSAIAVVLMLVYFAAYFIGYQLGATEARAGIEKVD